MTALKDRLKARLIAYNAWQETDKAARYLRWRAKRVKHAGTRKQRPRRLRPWGKAEQVAAAIEAAASLPESHRGQACANRNCEACLRVRILQGAASIARRAGDAL